VIILPVHDGLDHLVRARQRVISRDVDASPYQRPNSTKAQTEVTDVLGAHHEESSQTPPLGKSGFFVRLFRIEQIIARLKLATALDKLQSSQPTQGVVERPAHVGGAEEDAASELADFIGCRLTRFLVDVGEGDYRHPHAQS
jgi:hypothetical protein